VIGLYWAVAVALYPLAQLLPPLVAPTLVFAAALIAGRAAAGDTRAGRHHDWFEHDEPAEQLRLRECCHEHCGTTHAVPHTEHGSVVLQRGGHRSGVGAVRLPIDNPIGIDRGVAMTTSVVGNVVVIAEAVGDGLPALRVKAGGVRVERGGAGAAKVVDGVDES